MDFAASDLLATVLSGHERREKLCNYSSDPFVAEGKAVAAPTPMAKKQARG
ncbi:MAG: hypothetical protein LBV49_12190 [Azonexus sp.]|nr:hypothetical protein [Azonexus sp.]